MKQIKGTCGYQKVMNDYLLGIHLEIIEMTKLLSINSNIEGISFFLIEV